jgi:hypothetical protein
MLNNRKIHAKRASRDPRPVLGFIFLLMMSAGLLNLLRTPNVFLSLDLADDNHPLDSHDLLNNIRNICTNTSIQALNKPHLRIEFANDGMEPISCHENGSGSAQCNADIAKFKSWANGGNSEADLIFKNSMRRFEQQSRRSRIELFNSLNSVTSMLNSTSQQADFNKLINKIWSLRYIAELAVETQATQVGNCREQTYNSVFQLLQLPVNLKIQLIHGKYLEASGRESNHIYALINGNLPDMAIDNDPDAVAAYLNEINQGYLCDPWNEGYFEKIGNTNLKIYSSWTSIEVITICRDFDFSDLPVMAVNAVKEELYLIGLNPGFFSKTATAKNLEAADSQDQYHLKP